MAEHGRGVFVRTSPVVRRVASDRFARRRREQGQSAFIADAEGIGAPSVDELEVGHEVASLEVRKCLGLASRAKVLARRRRYLTEEVGARMPSAEERVRLRLPEGTPVLTVSRIAFETNGSPRRGPAPVRGTRNAGGRE